MTTPFDDTLIGCDQRFADALADSCASQTKLDLPRSRRLKSHTFDIPHELTETVVELMPAMVECPNRRSRQLVFV